MGALLSCGWCKSKKNKNDQSEKSVVPKSNKIQSSNTPELLKNEQSNISTSTNIRPSDKLEANTDQPFTTSETDNIHASNGSDSNTSIHSSAEILDDDFCDEITEAIEKHTASLPDAYQTERERLVNEMKSSPTGHYLGLIFSEYPDKNRLLVNAMAGRTVTSKTAREQLVDRIDANVEASFQSRSADWTTSAREAARPLVTDFITKRVNEAFDRIKFE